MSHVLDEAIRHLTELVAVDFADRGPATLYTPRGPEHIEGWQRTEERAELRSFVAALRVLRRERERSLSDTGRGYVEYDEFSGRYCYRNGAK